MELSCLLWLRLQHKQSVEPWLSRVSGIVVEYPMQTMVSTCMISLAASFVGNDES